MEAATAEATPEAKPEANASDDVGAGFEELAMCDVCGLGDWEDDNKMIFCDDCNLGVHQACYGSGANKIPDGPWFCDACSYSKRTGKPKPECVLCPKAGGALKRTSDARWAHIVCALWIPEAQFLDTTGRDMIHTWSVNEKRLDLTCSICGEQSGACIQCKAPRCLTAFHAACARHGGVHMVEKEKEEYVDHTVFCEKHRPATVKKKKRRREMKW